MQTNVRVRTELRLAPPVSGGQKDEELIAFAGFCASRIARDLRGLGEWDLFVVGGLEGQSDAIVRVQVGRETVEARSRACDPAHAIWNAMCEVEPRIREVACRRASA